MPCENPVSIHCGNCGGNNIKADAYAEWNEEAQKWELANVFDDRFCDDCGHQVQAYEYPIIEQTAEQVAEEERAAAAEAMQDENRAYFEGGV